MSGVAVIVALLKASAAVTGIAPTIMAGDLPLNAPLAGIGVKRISDVSLNFIRINETPKRHTERVQVTWIFQGARNAPSGVAYPSAYASAAAMDPLVLAACPSQRGTIGGVACETITPDVAGPDFSDVATDFYSGSRDFLVGWVSAT